MKKQCEAKTNFNNRRRHAYCATAIVAAATILTLAVNTGITLLEEALNLRIDVSAEQYTTLTDESKSLLAELDKPIYLYYIGSEHQGDIRVTELLRRYAASSDNVTYKPVSPSSYPGFTYLYDPEESGISADSVIVSDSNGILGETPLRYRVLSPADLYYTSEPYYGESGELVSDYVSFRAEQRITSAIEYVVSNRSLATVFLNGTATSIPSTRFQRDLGALFFDVRGYDADRPLNPHTQTLILAGQEEDISEAEYEAISAFLLAGGHAIFLMDNIYVVDNKVTVRQKPLPRMTSLLSSYGVAVGHNVIVESDPSKTYMSRTSLIPQLSTQSPVTQPLVEVELRPVLSYASELIITPLDDVSVDVLLRTDLTSYAKSLTKNISSYSREPDDASGPFIIGLIAHKGDSAIAVFGSSSFVATEEAYSNKGNAQLFLNTLNSLNNRMDAAAIGSHTVYAAFDPAYKLDISSEMEKVSYIVLAAGILPITVLIAGIIRHLKRQRL